MSDESIENYVPTTQQVRDAVLLSGRSFDQIIEIDDPYYGYETHDVFVEPGSAFDRWLSVHDRQVAEEAVRDRLPDGAKWFPVEGGIMWQGKVYYPADYVMTREDIRQVAENAWNEGKESAIEMLDRKRNRAWPPYLNPYAAVHPEPADSAVTIAENEMARQHRTRAEYEKEQSDGK